MSILVDKSDNFCFVLDFMKLFNKSDRITFKSCMHKHVKLKYIYVN